jgi:hypothetical protein
LSLLAAAGFVELRDRRPRTGLFHASITARLLTLMFASLGRGTGAFIVA